jgi:hypothetical protein
MRLLVRYELARHLSVFAGLTVNVLLQLDEEKSYRPLPWVDTTSSRARAPRNACSSGLISPPASGCE